MEIIKFEDVESKIFTIRNEQVILDSDVALLYGVETRDINKAVKNNLVNGSRSPLLEKRY